MAFASELAWHLYLAFRRVFPRCGMIWQAIAFNLFLAFFPVLLIAVAIATSSTSGRSSLIEITSAAEQLLPPGSRQFVFLGAAWNAEASARRRPAEAA
jgi:membrane protein